MGAGAKTNWSPLSVGGCANRFALRKRVKREKRERFQIPPNLKPLCRKQQNFSRRRVRASPIMRREDHMLFRGSIGAAALTAALLTATAAQAFDDAKYCEVNGQWHRAEGNAGAGRFDPTKPPCGLQGAPLTAEYQAIYEANLANKEAGGQGSDPTYKCLPPGMPRIMHAYAPMEVVVMPDTTYILMEHIHDNRRIHTDGRDFPEDMAADPMFAGYSIGKWVDEDGDGRYDALLVETRGLKGPRNYDVSGIPLHRDNESIIRERIYLDKTDPNLLHDEITIIDHALTRP